MHAFDPQETFAPLGSGHSLDALTTPIGLESQSVPR